MSARELNAATRALLSDISRVFSRPTVTFFGHRVPPIRQLGLYECPRCGRVSFWTSCCDEKCPGCEFVMDQPTKVVTSVVEAEEFFGVADDGARKGTE